MEYLELIFGFIDLSLTKTSLLCLIDFFKMSGNTSSGFLKVVTLDVSLQMFLIVVPLTSKPFVAFVIN